MSEDVHKMLQDHESRIKKLEEQLLKGSSPQKKSRDDHKGFAGGIRFIMNNGFLDTPKSTKEIRAELAREGYHYSSPTVDKLVRVDFMKNKRLLVRTKEGSFWKYVVRK